MLQQSLIVLINKSCSESEGQKVSHIHEVEMCCQRAFILHGPTIHGSSRADPSLQLDSGAQRREGKELLPCKGGVYFYTPTVFSCLDSWCLLCSESCLTELIESFVEESTQTGVIGSSSFQEHRRAGIELGGLPSWIQLKLWARPAAAPAWQDKGRKSLGRGDSLPLKPWILRAALRGGWRCY